MKQQDAQKNAPPRSEPLRWYQWPFAALGHLMGIWVLLILFEWLGGIWGNEVGTHAKSTLLLQLDALQADYPGVLNRLLPWVSELILNFSDVLSLNFTGTFAFITPFWHGAVYVTLALMVRIALLFFAYPLFLMAMFLGAFDGLVARQRRIAFVARETETVHYYAYKSLPWVVMGCSYLWLFVPGIVAISPSLMLIPGVVATGILVQQTLASYKKYL
ncbi:hypothetical protein VII00023_06152 [Vibrio ichthyoenteri ATCC 700023]|uniref:Uncharacterized protein n=1 Tax=Vibrio ichthyoenteri ATCC 700023 TaxID=870968 RepID=F9S1U9_9VIBR|nr:DUF4400 domain-containing protein [Vibrio ichthyoenteri]EGU41189.1 hypothetical protein VII00023_06152 [Vibrio ichthyoenteri ATCC 700023]